MLVVVNPGSGVLVAALLCTLDRLEGVKDLSLTFPHLGLGGEGFMVRRLQLQGLVDESLDVVQRALSDQDSCLLNEGEAGLSSLL